MTPPQVSALSSHAGFVAALGLVAGCASAPRPEVLHWHQTVAVDPGLHTLDVTLCTEGPSPGWLVPPYETHVALEALRTPRALPSGTALTTDATGLVWPHPREGCVRYGIDLTLAAREHHMHLQQDGAVLVPSSNWLWRPANAVGYPADNATTRLVLPEGVEASAPWPDVGDGRRAIDGSALEWQGYLALGAIARTIEHINGVTFDVAHVGATRSIPVARWLSHAVASVTTLVGHFPVAAVQIILVPGARRGEPVDFGLTCRGGGASVLFVMNPDATEATLANDWVATHEFTHLAHPVVRDGDGWLREGIATYYQEVLRARTGDQSAAVAWGSLAEGLRRGSTAPGSGTLAHLSETMHETHAYTRVYWAGVAIAMRVDIALRQASGGRVSLDTLVQALTNEYAHDRPGRTWTADEVGAVFDRVAGSPVWTTEAARWLGSDAFPDYASTLDALGVRGEAAGVTLDPSAPLAALRDAVTAGANAPRTR